MNFANWSVTKLTRVASRALPIAMVLALLNACESLDPAKTNISFPKLNAIKIPTVIGTIEFNFAQEEKRKVESGEKLASSASNEAPASPNSLRFRQFDFDTGPLPDGCKPFEIGRYGNLVFPNDGEAVGKIQEKVDNLKKRLGYAPDEAIIALATYNSTAFRSSCGPVTMAKLKPGSKINGWPLTAAAVQLFGSAGQGQIDVTPRITIVAIDKKNFEGHLKPTAANLLLSRFRFEIPPNTDSLAADPKTASTIVSYSETFEDVTLSNATRHVLAGGVMRIFVGKSYLYLIDFYTNTEGVSEKQSSEFRRYLDSFKYVGDTGTS